MQNLILE